MLYLLNIQFSKPQQEGKSDFYYAILGAFLHLFEDENFVYDSIIKLSFSTKENLSLSVTISGEKAYNYIISYLLKNPGLELSLNGEKYQLKQLNFNFEIFSLADLKYKEFNKFVLRFHSPTFVRQQNITYMLPNPSQFLFSVYQKLISYCPDLKIENEKNFKEWLKYQLYVGEFDLASRLITLKKGKKAGVVGFCTYYLEKGEMDEEQETFIRLLYGILKGIKFFGIGSCTSLGCGNVSCFISNKK